MVPKSLSSSVFFLKKALDSFPVTANSVGRFFGLKGSTLNRYYKCHLSDFEDWDQKDHAKEWILLAQNIGSKCCIDETTLCDEVYTIFSNKAGRGKKGSIIAVVRGTKSEVVSSILLKMSVEERSVVEEVTMDFSDSMYSIVKTCFPNATIVIDCFHIIQRLCEGLDEMRLRFKRLAVTETKKAEADFKQKEEEKAKKRAYKREWYAKKTEGKKPKGKKRGRKRIRKQKYQPITFSNGDTKVELYTRSRGLLHKAGGKWSKTQSKRAKILFKEAPKLREGYSLICSIRSIFSNKTLTRDQAKVKLHKWYDKVAKCTLREIKSARDCIKMKEEEVLNYFIGRSTNAAAESLNAKMKGFRAQLHGIGDIPFFLYRVCTLFG